MKKYKLFILILPLFSFLFSCSNNEDNQEINTLQIESSTTESLSVKESTPSAFVLEYDELQQLYLDLNSDMSYSEMIELVKNTELPYSEQKYNGSRCVQVAFTEDCTSQKYKKESGDYLKIIYNYSKGENSINDILEKYTFGTCIYCPSDSQLELINHVSGHYFSYSEAGNYITKLGNNLELNKNISKEEQLDYYFKSK